MKTNNFVKPENKELKKQVTLVGMMGVGKTTFGKKLAAKLQVPFYDVDHEIEGDIGHSVSWIFENAGEEEFRKLETEKIRQLLDNGKPKIVALGGGAFISNENRKEIKSKSASVWLYASPETIYERVSYRRDRPLLEAAEDKMALINQIIKEREEYYSLADFKIITDKTTHKEIVDKIIEKVL